ncbi:hypothetical protein [Amycolatopsis sp. YIM 10]|uniref:hypothetical protein n=1 Tax=Amycolatopsis sp. YIM 10 TaxID=2653857 RepID=UPI00128FFB83|nr:hypothetical protein [Amycolatopsis sp. YIM 10]QFU85532.1 hypothetical protein YIM_01510 [Amycolatopsis sp. YIM 10]
MSPSSDGSASGDDLPEPRVSSTPRKRLWRRYRFVWRRLLSGAAFTTGGLLVGYAIEWLSRFW